MGQDPIVTNPGLYRVIMENERVRVLEYRDKPGDGATPHRHPDSVMVTLSSFQRRLVGPDGEVDVDFGPGLARWLGAQEHAGENIGDTDTHVMLVELKEPRPADGPVNLESPLGPTLS